MARSKDWVRMAAIEICTKGLTTVEEIVDEFWRHCPFEKDRAYVEFGEPQKLARQFQTKANYFKDEAAEAAQMMGHDARHRSSKMRGKAESWEQAALEVETFIKRHVK